MVSVQPGHGVCGNEHEYNQQHAADDELNQILLEEVEDRNDDGGVRDVMWSVDDGVGAEVGHASLQHVRLYFLQRLVHALPQHSRRIRNGQTIILVLHTNWSEERTIEREERTIERKMRSNDREEREREHLREKRELFKIKGRRKKGDKREQLREKGEEYYNGLH